MAIRYAVASGNWSSTATWDGGTLPGSTDDVYSNGFTVSIDQSVTVNSLKKISNASPVIAAGGAFGVTAAATVTITAGIATTDSVSSSTGVLTLNAGSFAVTLNANVVGGNSSNRWGVRVESGYTGALTVNGDVTGGSGSSSAYGMYVSSSAQVTINGDVTGGASAIAVVGESGAVLTVNGDVTGSGSANAAGIANSGASSQTTIIGSITGGAVGPGASITGGFLRIDASLGWGPNGASPFTGSVAPQFMRTGSHLAMHAPSDDNWPAATGAQIYVQRYNTGLPAPEDVREGTVYDSTSSSTGTLAVPPPASVAAGVPTDDTVGTAALVLADVAALTGAQIAAATTA